MMKVRERSSAFFDGLIKNLAVLAFGCLSLLLVIMLVAVFSRYFLREPLGWVVEVSRYLLLYITFLASAYLLERDRHVRVDVVLRMLNRKTQAWINGITSCFLMIICFVLTLSSAEVSWDFFKRGLKTQEVLEIPKYLLTSIILVGFFLLFIQSTRRTWGYWEKFRELRNKHKST